MNQLVCKALNRFHSIHTTTTKTTTTTIQHTTSSFIVNYVYIYLKYFLGDNHLRSPPIKYILTTSIATCNCYLLPLGSFRLFVCFFSAFFFSMHRACTHSPSIKLTHAHSIFVVLFSFFYN